MYGVNNDCLNHTAKSSFSDVITKTFYVISMDPEYRSLIVKNGVVETVRFFRVIILIYLKSQVANGLITR